MGLTLVSYLCGVGEEVAGTVVAATVAAAPAAGLGLGLDPPAGGGEEWCTRSLKLCPLHVLTMPGPEKGRK